MDLQIKLKSSVLNIFSNLEFYSNFRKVVLLRGAVIFSVTADISPLMVLKLIPFLKNKIQILYSNCYVEFDSIGYWQYKMELVIWQNFIYI